MPSLSVKNVPEELLERLRVRAQLHHRSLQGELLAILEDAARPKPLTLEEVVHRFTERGLQTGDESTAMIREERDAR